ncbi:Chloroperoxidase [Microdochium bolleyi]|uniref:Chloroperoxidase n=1 Tax=Microdochium bolleyi TaxID=196109 RepID=A0A136IZM6_9PEZI|nr:Chloroperoxidase [Microdochium bolleyi]
MRLSNIAGQLAVGAACLSGVSNAYATPENLARLAARDGLELNEIIEGLARLKERALLVDSSKPIQVDGAHEFRPPNVAAGDQRGPCPGLNALSNHGYFSRDGVVGFFEAIAGINGVFGMGIDLATLIAAMGLTGTGNPLSLNPGFSIGGKSPKSQNLLGNLLGLLGTPRGLDGSHNFIEADSSLTRDDLYITGDASTMNMDKFMEVHDKIPVGGALSVEGMGDIAAAAIKTSIATNPLFYYGPYTGLLVRNAGLLFGIRLLSNHSDEFPRGGNLDRENFKSLWGVTTNADGTLKYNRGWERIPSNWYRMRGDYNLVDLNLDLLSWIAKHPEIANIGGNMGTTNSFTGVDLQDLTGGALNAVKLLQGNNLVCFSLEIVKAFAPNSLSTLFATIAKPLQMINDAVGPPLLSLACPAMGELTAGGKALLDKYPGAKKSGFAL